MPTLLMPNGCAPMTVPPAKPPRSVQTSGVNGVGAKPPSQNWRKYSKSANTVRYLSQISRSNEPQRYSRSLAAIDGVRAAKLNRAGSLPITDAVEKERAGYCEPLNWFALAGGVGDIKPK